MKNNDIPGTLMRPCSMTLKENERIMMGTKVSVKAEFMAAYRRHKQAMEIVAECAKVYIQKNWKRVKDWSKMEVVMEDANTLKGLLNSANGGKPLKEYVEYYNFDEDRPLRVASSAGKALSRTFERMHERNRKRHNPALTVSSVVLDPTDGDLSITINERSHMWISDDTVITIADYMERHLAKRKPVPPVKRKPKKG